MDGTDAARTLSLVALQIADSHFRPNATQGRLRTAQDPFRRVRNPVRTFVSAARSGVIKSRRPLGALT